MVTVPWGLEKDMRWAWMSLGNGWNHRHGTESMMVTTHAHAGSVSGAEVGGEGSHNFS